MEVISGMDFFKKAKSVRLKSHHGKYLTADADGESIVQDRSSSSNSGEWTVEITEGPKHAVRLKSCNGKYLTALDEEYLLGVTGRKVVQTLPAKLDSSVEWEPIRDGMRVKLKTRYGNYLRANGGLPPWRNSVTHDIPHHHHDWIFWEVEVVVDSTAGSDNNNSPTKVSRSDSEFFSNSSIEDSPKRYEGRVIYYSVADDEGNVDNAVDEWPCFQLKGHGLEELTRKLEDETKLEDIIVCSRSNSGDGRLYPMRLALPPNGATMHVVVIPSTSRVANDFMPAAPTCKSDP
ncbi:hypothetical protein ACP275_08G019400 [Erythranthe tilingii]